MTDESPSWIQQEERIDHQLVRGIGIPALTANIVSSTIGAGIFVIPATVAKGLGPAAPLAFVCCAIAMVLFVTCFAIAGSRVSLTGGLYAYVEVAFGRYVGFLAGMLYFLTALGAVAGVVNVFANSVALVVPFLGGPVMRIMVMLGVYGVLVLINIRGVREGAGAVTVITVAKLLPLLLFICVGIFFIHVPNLAWSGWPSSKVVRRCRDPVDFRVRRNRSGFDSERRSEKPGAHRSAFGVSGAGDHDDHLPHDSTRRSGNARRQIWEIIPMRRWLNRRRNFSAIWVALILLAGASISAFGFVTSDILSSPRMIFAFGRDGALPQFFAHVHPRYRSPDVAIITYATLAFALINQRHVRAARGALECRRVADVSALLCCLLVLVQRDVRSDGEPFNFPGMKIVPALAIVAIIWILMHATAREFLVTGIVLFCRSLVLRTENRRACPGRKWVSWRAVVGQTLRLPSHIGRAGDAPRSTSSFSLSTVSIGRS